VSFGFRSKTNGNERAQDQPAAEATAAKQGTLRDVLKEKLVSLAHEGNVSAIRELLDRPYLTEGPKSEKVCRECGGPKNLTREEAMAELDAVLNRVEARSVVASLLRNAGLENKKSGVR
jgi:hypothetical protein